MSRRTERRKHYDKYGEYKGRSEVEIKEDTEIFSSSSSNSSSLSFDSNVSDIIISIFAIIGFLSGLFGSISAAQYGEPIGVIIIGSILYIAIGTFLGFFLGILISILARYWWLILIMALIGLASGL